MNIRPYRHTDLAEVIALWQVCGLTREWNDPQRDIERKLTVHPELFLIGTVDEGIVATAMVGYEGHRGWVNYLGVLPDARGLSYGRAMMIEAERLLTERGCPKLNLQIRSSNEKVIAFYKKLGYGIDEVVSMGKRLIKD